MIEGVIEYFSYGGLLVVLLLGSRGLPIPEEVPIVAAGMLSHQQMMRWWLSGRWPKSPGRSSRTSSYTLSSSAWMLR